jgi:hypothetical protein
MKLSRLSMFYLASYLLPSGILLVVAPRLVFELMFSSQPAAYGDVIPRMAGALAIALGIIVVQLIRLRIEALYGTLVFARVILVSIWIWLYARTHDPFFLILTGIVGFGALFTAAGILHDRRK